MTSMMIHYPSTHVVSTTSLLPFHDESFDAVICELVLEHVTDPCGLADEMYRVLKP